MSGSDARSVVEAFRRLSEEDKTAAYIDIDVIWKALQVEAVEKQDLGGKPE
jgi:hypothetical protein